MNKKTEELNPKAENVEDGPIWKDGPVIFGILLFPLILLIILILYLIHTFIEG